MIAGHDEAHGHTPANGSLSPLLAMLLTLGYAGVEAGVGWWSGSLALLGDAGHMVTDAVALLIAVLAARIARLPPSPRHSFGMARAQLVAALANAAFMLAVVGMLSVEAIARLVDPIDVKGEAVTVVASAGLLLNMAVAWMLSRGKQDLNVRAALLHVMGDLLGSVAAIASGVLVMFTGWTRADPVLTFVIAGLIGFSSLRLAREALHGLMEGVPFHLSLAEIGKAMAAVPSVASVHDLHIWSISAERIALSAHVLLERMGQWEAVLAALQNLLDERFGIEHVTLQPEFTTHVLQPLVRSNEPSHATQGLADPAMGEELEVSLQGQPMHRS
jgi:cobalt-zinc-cadmium efflux system protein